MRSFIQSKLNEIPNIDSGGFVPEGIIEMGVTYFGYELQSNFQSQDYDKNDVRRISIIGFVIRRIKDTEDTLEIIDEATEQITQKLKELNFKVSTQDISLFDNIRKVKVTGYTTFNEINNELI